MKPKLNITDHITSTPLKKTKKEERHEQEDMDSTTPDPTQPNTEITYTKKHEIGEPVKKKTKSIK